MRVAYYAPLKPVDHPVPSGDRLMARAFLALLETLGHRVEVASTLRSFDRAGDRAHQLALRDRAAIEQRRLLELFTRGPAPDLWFTYHAHHKAPDWLGPGGEPSTRDTLCDRGGLDRRQASRGPWDIGHLATIEAVNAASAVLALTEVDARNLRRHMSDPTRLLSCSRRSSRRELAIPASVTGRGAHWPESSTCRSTLSGSSRSR
jgi:hypothetical protein